MKTCTEMAAGRSQTAAGTGMRSSGNGTGARRAEERSGKAGAVSAWTSGAIGTLTEAVDRR